MSKDQKRSVKTAQLYVRQLSLQIDGALATPVPGGLDAKQVQTVTDLGAGNYLIIFKKPFDPTHMFQCFGQVLGNTDGYMDIDAIAYDRVTVSTRLVSTQARADSEFMLFIHGTDSRILY